MCDEQEWFTTHIEQSRQKVALIAQSLRSAKRRPWNTYGREQLLSALEGDRLVYQYVVLYFVYPRFDINVTKSMNHLLKIPFSVHAGTCNVSVPINHQEIVRHYGLDKILRFERPYDGAWRRFEVERPLKVDQDISEVVRWFSDWVDDVCRGQ